MSNPIIYDDTGITIKSVDQIQATKKELLKEHGIVIQKNGFYDIANYPSSEIDRQIIVELKKLFDTIGEGGTFFKEMTDKLSLPSSCTFDAVKRAILQIDGVDFYNSTSGAGVVDMHLIITDRKHFIDQNLKTLNPSIKQKLWEVFYKVLPTGTLFNGEIEVDGLNNQGQKKIYKFSLGKPKYAYMKIYYKINHKDHIYTEIDSQIREIYKNTIANNYKDMGTSYAFQDFLSPVSMVKGIRALRVGVCIKDDDTTIANTIEDKDYTFNKDIEIKDNEILFFNTTERLLIDIDKE
ncbi:DUF276 domain-containing protein [Candidatus Borreliella tachyglossi]|uniref:DUF276 domain-containing protein n=1 Tax=Candidatus Borreliella tachyglossi TaxID=1964448 RepID=UPI0040412926